MNDDINIIVERLKKCILASELSYVELEKITKITKSSIQRYASGSTKKIPVDAISVLARALKVSPAYIMGWQDEPAPVANNPISFQEKHLLENFNRLSNQGRQKLVDYSDDLLSSGNYSEGDYIEKHA